MFEAAWVMSVAEQVRTARSGRPRSQSIRGPLPADAALASHDVPYFGSGNADVVENTIIQTLEFSVGAARAPPLGDRGDARVEVIRNGSGAEGFREFACTWR